MKSSFHRMLFVAIVIAISALLGQNTWSQSPHPNTAIAAEARLENLDGEMLQALTPLDRQILKLVDENQLDALLGGTDPAEIYLSNGETLSALTERAQEASSRNLVFAPVRPCRLIDTRNAPSGYLLAGETRGFLVRGTDAGYAAQGGAEEGCGVPGLEGVTLKTNAVRAVALNILTVDVGGPGSLAIWPANQSEPEIGSVSFANALAGGGLTSGVLVPICDEAGLDPCSAADLKIKAKMSGAHVAADIVGYFHEAPLNNTQQADGTVARTADAAAHPQDSEQSDGFYTSPEARSPQQPATAPTSFGAQSAAATAKGEADVVDHMLPLEDAKASPEQAFEISLRGQLATGHGAGAAVYGWIPNDQFVYNATAVKGHATTGNAVHGEAPNGRAIYGQTNDGYAVYGFDGGANANRGYAGYFYSSNGIGVYGYSNGDRTHPNTYAPAIYGQSNRGVGVYGRGDTSDSYSFYNEGGRFEGGSGIYARGSDSDGYGARIFSNNYRGMYVQGATSWFDAYFGGNAGISTNGIVDRSAANVVLAVNIGSRAIEPGDLIAIAGTAPSPETGEPMLGVARLDATNRNALIGVAKQAFAATLVKQPDTEDYIDFSPVSGAAEPQQHLTIVTGGLMPAVKLSGLPGRAAWRIGDRIELAEVGAEAVTLGKIASVPDLANGTIAIFVDID